MVDSWEVEQRQYTRTLFVLQARPLFRALLVPPLLLLLLQRQLQVLLC